MLVAVPIGLDALGVTEPAEIPDADGLGGEFEIPVEVAVGLFAWTYEDDAKDKVGDAADATGEELSVKLLPLLLMRVEPSAE